MITDQPKRVVNTAEREPEKGETYEKQGDIEILVGLVRVFGVLLRSLSFIHRIEIVPEVAVLEVAVLVWLEVDLEGLLNAMDRSQFVRHRIKLRTPQHTIEGQC